MAKLKGKVAVVTGSSSGFGRAIAKAYAEEGAKVMCSDIRKEARPEGYEKDIQLSTDEAIQKAGGEAIFVKCDVTKEEEVKALVEAAVEAYGKIDIIMNNAGVQLFFVRRVRFRIAGWKACATLPLVGRTFQSAICSPDCR